MAFPSDWSGHYLISPINPTESGGVTGFVFSLDLQLLSGLSSLVNASGSDIRVSDVSNNQIACDLLYYNNGYGILNFSGNNSTGIQFKVWYGNSGISAEPATGTYGQYNVYRTGIYGYYPSGGWTDRTRYQNNLTMSGTPGTGYGGPITGGFYTSYNEDDIGYRSISSGTGLPLSLLGWGRTVITTGTPVRGMISMSNSGGLSNESVSLGLAAASINARIGYVGNTFTNNTLLPTDQWIHLAGLFRGTGSAMSVRMVSASGNIFSTGVNGAVPTTSNTFAIGGIKISSSNISTFNGDIALVQRINEAIPTGYVYYDYLMGANNAVFWNGTYSPNSSLTSFYLTGYSNTVTQSLANISKNIYLNGYSQTITSDVGNLLVTKYLGSISSTRTSTYAIITVVDGGVTLVPLQGISHTTTSSQGLLQKAIDLAGVSITQSNAVGGVVKNIQLFADSRSSTSALAMVTMSVSLQAVSSTKTALSGFATVVDTSDQPDNDFEITVYVTIEKGKGLYICRQKDLDLFIARNNENLSLYIAQGLILP